MGYSFLDIIALWWHGLKQTILYYIPLLKPEQESTFAPTWFRRVFPDWLWGAYLPWDRRPTETWLYNYRYASNVLFKSWLDELKAQAIAGAWAVVIGSTGLPSYGYPTLADWLNAIRGRVGTWIPYWTNSLAEGLTALYSQLPYSIRHNLSTWDDIFYNIKESVKTWVLSRYSLAMSNLDTVWGWLQSTGGVLKAWYDDVGSWVSYIRLNFAAGVFSVLGGVWWRLVTFDRDALDYYYNLWGAYRVTLADFVVDPLGYIYDRVESYILSKW